MKVLFSICILFGSNLILANGGNSIELNVAKQVKKEIRDILKKGRIVYTYNPEGQLVKKTRDLNISAQDYAEYMKAYNLAHDLERKIVLRKKLEKDGFNYADFSEKVGPYLPIKPKQK